MSKSNRDDIDEDELTDFCVTSEISSTSAIAARNPPLVVDTLIIPDDSLNTENKEVTEKDLGESPEDSVSSITDGCAAALQGEPTSKSDHVMPQTSGSSQGRFASVHTCRPFYNPPVLYPTPFTFCRPVMFHSSMIFSPWIVFPAPATVRHSGIQFSPKPLSSSFASNTILSYGSIQGEAQEQKSKTRKELAQSSNQEPPINEHSSDKDQKPKAKKYECKKEETSLGCITYQKPSNIVQCASQKKHESPSLEPNLNLKRKKIQCEVPPSGEEGEPEDISRSSNEKSPEQRTLQNEVSLRELESASALRLDPISPGKKGGILGSEKKMKQEKERHQRF